MLTVLMIGSAVAVHHSDLGALHHDLGTSAAMELCLGVFMAVGTAIAAVAVALIGLGRRRAPSALSAGGLSRAVERPEPRARAGPALLFLLCISRR